MTPKHAGGFKTWFAVVGGQGFRVENGEQHPDPMTGRVFIALPHVKARMESLIELLREVVSAENFCHHEFDSGATHDCYEIDMALAGRIQAALESEASNG